MELTYTRQGDYNLPNLLPPQEKNSLGENLEIHLGKYALLRKRYLKESRKPLFVNLLTTGKLNAHLMEIEQTATESSVFSFRRENQGIAFNHAAPESQ